MADATSDGDVNRQFVLASRPTGEPTPEDFSLVEREVPEPDPHEVVVRAEYLSVDPYMRGRMRDAESYAEPWDVGDVMRAGVVGEVVDSEHPEFENGDVASGRLQWAEYGVGDGDDLRTVDPDVAPISTALGVLGMPGRTAYFGMLEVGEPRPGDTVVLSGAAGAVGSTAGQLARMAGARVVGIAGSDAKTEWLTDELGFDAAINYRTTEDVRAALAEACPAGIDVYYDNVGGPITDAAFANLAVDARVVICGQIALYNEEEVPVGPRKLGTLIRTRARRGYPGPGLRAALPRGERATRAVGRRGYAAVSRDDRRRVRERSRSVLGAVRGREHRKTVSADRSLTPLARPG